MLEKKPIVVEKSFLQNLRRLHPYQTMMYMAMVGSGFLFFVMLVSYTAQRFQTENIQHIIQLPKSFFISTVFMLLSAAAIKWARLYLRKDQLRKCTTMLAVVGILGLGFTSFQIIGWLEFYKSGFSLPTANVASTYVYVLSAIHLFHVLLGISFLTYVLIPFYKNSRNPVTELMFVTNPYQKKKMNMLFVFWNYIDVVWLIMFFYFAITF
jgi:cytochrome c oxidase subunit III